MLFLQLISQFHGSMRTIALSLHQLILAKRIDSSVDADCEYRASATVSHYLDMDTAGTELVLTRRHT